MNTSPRQQHSSSPQAWKLIRTKDLAVQEIIQERRAAMASGRLKGRRLFEPLMEGNKENNKIGLSSDMDPAESTEVRSLSFDYSEEDESCSSSSLPCLSSDSVDKDQEVKEVEMEDAINIVEVVEKTRRSEEGRPDNGGRYIVINVGMVAIALLVFAMYVSWTRSFEGHEVILVPT